MKIWSRVRYSTMDYGAIFPRELMYTTEGGKSFLARRFRPFIKFRAQRETTTGMAN